MSEDVFISFISLINFYKHYANKDFCNTFFANFALSDLFNCDDFLSVSAVAWKDNRFLSITSLFALTNLIMSYLFVAPSFCT